MDSCGGQHVFDPILKGENKRDIEPVCFHSSRYEMSECRLKEHDDLYSHLLPVGKETFEKTFTGIVS